MEMKKRVILHEIGSCYGNENACRLIVKLETVLKMNFALIYRKIGNFNVKFLYCRGFLSVRWQLTFHYNKPRYRKSLLSELSELFEITITLCQLSYKLTLGKR